MELSKSVQDCFIGGKPSNGRLVFGIFAPIAEFERELIRGRVRSGLVAAKARGTRIGRPNSGVDVVRIAGLPNSACVRRLLAGHRVNCRRQCENSAALSRVAWQNPARFDACKCFIISGASACRARGKSTVF
jgi:DNA invertase Pin-like site-specific DNA recombinase